MKSTVSFSDLLPNQARALETRQNANGALPAGHNGPYHDPETPIRNTAHFLFLLSAITDDLYTETEQAPHLAASYLHGSQNWPNVYSYHIRDKQGKDKCNGVVGQAWVIEALVAAASRFNRENLYDHAESLFLLHPWDNNSCLWHRVEPDSSVLAVDGTFNHQLWFAATASMLHRTPAAQERAHAFLTQVAANVQTYRNGVVKHDSPMASIRQASRSGIRCGLGNAKRRINKALPNRQTYIKSVGYHGFNLYAYAILKQAFPEHSFWKSKKFNKLLTPIMAPAFEDELDQSIFSWHYNLSGIEFAFAAETFLEDRKLAETWVNKQFQRTWLSEHEPLARNATDRNTANARIYQAARLKADYQIELPNE